MFDLPDLLKQLNSNPLNNENLLVDAKQAATFMPPPTLSIHSEDSSPLASISPPIAAFDSALPTSLISQINPTLCAAYFQLLQQQQQAQGQQALFNNLIQVSMAVQQSVPQFNSQAALLTATSTPSSIFPRFDALPSVALEKSSNQLVEARVSESEQSETRSLASRCSSSNQANAPSSPFDNFGDLLVPSNDKEGWCRNKKYIQTVENGYRCTVCNKVYGRYNSVSYHVTIYHRNPPIRCEVPGCQFTTREARYIYFHKYYRHNVPLPATIDTAARKCPFFSCKYVSKSPGMLEKHLARHVSDCSKNGRYECPNCDYMTMQHREMFEHLRIHQMGTDCNDKPGKRPAPGPSHNVFPCNQCSYKGRTLSNLEQHRHSKHQNNITISLPQVVDENLKSSAMSISPALDTTSLNLEIALKALFPENLFAMVPTATVNAKP